MDVLECVDVWVSVLYEWVCLCEWVVVCLHEWVDVDLCVGVYF